MKYVTIFWRHEIQEEAIYCETISRSIFNHDSVMNRGKIRNMQEHRAFNVTVMKKQTADT